jgi:hypothetical protein
MGAWGHRPFDNDTTNDWAYDLEDVDDLSVVKAAFDAVEAVGPEFLDQDVACNALGACEVLARLSGRPGYTDAYTKKVDQWVAAHKIKPPPALLRRASGAIDRILGDHSELRELWEDSGDANAWRAAMEDLRTRVKG